MDAIITYTEGGNNGTVLSVAHLCSLLNLPNWIVDLRHDAAHEDLPGLPALRLASRAFLIWLEKEFWGLVVGERGKVRGCVGFFDGV